MPNRLDQKRWNTKEMKFGMNALLILDSNVFHDDSSLPWCSEILFQEAENPEAGNPQLDEERGETDDEYVNEEEGYSSEGWGMC